MGNTKSLHIVVSGRVQGVGFRWFTRKKANKLGIVGSVENLITGEVEVYATGKEEKIEQFIAELWKGPSFGLVTDIKTEELSKIKNYDDFFILVSGKRW